MPVSHRLKDIDGPYLNTDGWKNGGARTSTGGGGKKPPKKPPTKTGGLPDKPYEWDNNSNSKDPMNPNNKKRWE